MVFEDSPDGKPVIQRCSTLRLGTARPRCHCHAPSPRHAPTTPRPSPRHAPLTTPRPCGTVTTPVTQVAHAPTPPRHRCSISSTPSDHRSFLNMCSQLRGHDVHPDTGAGIIQSMCCSPVDSLGCPAEQPAAQWEAALRPCAPAEATYSTRFHTQARRRLRGARRGGRRLRDDRPPPRAAEAAAGDH